jgi:alkylation response protein AidB-like acyl-CoA dehydrogenase
MDFSLEETQEILKNTVGEFALKEIRPLAREAEQKQTIPEQLLRSYLSLGISRISLPQEVGGEGLDLLTSLLVGEELGYGDPALAMALPRPGPAGWILAYGGNEEQKRFLKDLPHQKNGILLYTPWMCVEEEIPLPLTFTETKKGYRIRGEYPSAFPLNDPGFYLAFASHPRKKVVQAFLLLPEEVSIESSHRSCGCEVLKIAHVKIDQTVDKGRTVGENPLDLLKSSLLIERSYLASVVLGACKAVLEEAKEYAQTREAFGRKIGEFQAVAFMIANMAIEIEGARNLLWKGAWLMDQKDPSAPLFLTEGIIQVYLCGDRVATDGVQVFGGNGFVQDYPLEKWMRDIRTLTLLYGSRPYILESVLPESFASLHA